MRNCLFVGLDSAWYSPQQSYKLSTYSLVLCGDNVKEPEGSRKHIFFQRLSQKVWIHFPVLSLTPTFLEPITPSQEETYCFMCPPRTSLEYAYMSWLPELRQLFRQHQDVQVTKNQPGDHLLPHSIYLPDGTIVLIQKPTK